MARSEATTPKLRARRWLKRIGLGLAAFVAVVLLLLGAILAVLSTHAGSEKLRQLVVSKANEALEGHVSIEALSLRGPHLILRGVRLDDPEGHEVARVREVEARVRLDRLLREQLDLTFVRIDAPVLHVVQDEQGGNLQRALAPRHPSPKEPSGKSSFSVAIDDLRLERGVIDLRQTTAKPERHVHLEGLAVRGRAEVGGERLGAHVALDGQLSEPLEAALALRLEAAGQGDSRRADVDLSLGDAKLVAHARMSDAEHAEVRLESLAVPPDLVAAFVPSYPLQVPAHVKADLQKRGELASIQLNARAGSARAELNGSFNLAAHRSDGVTLHVRHVNLAELTEHGPASDVALDLDAAGGGTSADDASGRLALDVPASKMEGQQMGPVRVRATADHGRVELEEFSANVPGVSLTARGTASRAKLGLSGTLVATDLDAFSHTLGRLGKKRLSLSGSGKLSFEISGRAANPAVKVDGAFPSLRFEDKRVSELSLHAAAPELKHPATAQLSVAAKTLALEPKRQFRDVRVEAHGDGQTIALEANVHGAAELALGLQAQIDRDNHGGALESFSLRYPEASWRLVAPVRLSAVGRSLQIGHLELRADRQSIALEARKRGNRVHARVSIVALDLSRFPKALVNPSLKLAGRLDLSASVNGSTREPDAVAKLDLRNGRFKKYSGLSVHLDASYVKERAKGELNAQGTGVKLSSKFDVPVKALKTGGPEPVRIDAQIAQFDLGEWLKTVGIDKPVRGLASANLHVTGTARDPRLHLVAGLKRLQVRSAPSTDLQLTAESGDAGKLLARVDLELSGKKSEVELRTPFSAGELLRRPLHKADLMAAPFQLDADLREFPLEALSQAGLAQKPVKGTLSAEARLKGAPKALAGTLSVNARGVATNDLPAVDGALKLALGNDVRVSIYAAQQDHVLVDASARVGASTAALQDKERLASAPISIKAQFGPLAIGTLQKLTQPKDVDPARAQPPLKGTLSGSLDANGTLRDPKLALRLKADQFGAEQLKQTGNVAISFDYAQAKEALAIALDSNGGKLEIKANTAIDLSYPAVRERRDLKGSAVSASLLASRFDPGFLSGVTSMIETIGGQIDGNGKLWGTLGAPKGSGQLEWKNGVLETNGYGDFKELHLLAQASNDRMELKDLSMKSGDGSAKLTGLAVREGKDFKIHSEAHLDKFPVITDGELMATVSFDSKADGHASATRLNIQSLSIPSAHLQLPDVKRKDLQKLSPAKDIVLTMNGKPVKGQKNVETVTSPAAMGTGGSGAAGTQGGFQARVKIDAPRNIWIQGNDIDTEVGFSDGFRVEYASGAPQVFGDVLLLRGRLEVFGRRFDWQKDSKITFGGPPIEPSLDVTATYKNETEQVVVNLKIQGDADHVQLNPTSEPPLSETEIYTLLATGHTTLKHGSGNTSPAGEAASLVGSFAAGQLKKTLSSVLPLDVFSIQAGDQGLSGTKVEAGTYVNDRLYVGFTGRVGADPLKGENSNQVDLDYQLSKHWSLSGDYGDAQAGAADLIWEKNY